jgi:hypothetical protein
MAARRIGTILGQRWVAITIPLSMTARSRQEHGKVSTNTQSLARERTGHVVIDRTFMGSPGR